MPRRLLQRVGRDGQTVCQRAEGVQLGPAEDGVALGILRAVGVGGPATTWVQDDALAEPGLSEGGAAGRSDDAAAVGEEGDAEGRAGV